MRNPYIPTGWKPHWVLAPSLVKRIRAVHPDWDGLSGGLPDYLGVGDKARQVVGYDHRLDWVAQKRGWPPGARRVLQREYTR